MASQTSKEACRQASKQANKRGKHEVIVIGGPTYLPIYTRGVYCCCFCCCCGMSCELVGLVDGRMDGTIDSSNRAFDDDGDGDDGWFTHIAAARQLSSSVRSST